MNLRHRDKGNTEQQKMSKTQDEIVTAAISELIPYAKKRGVIIEYIGKKLRFYSYSKESSEEIEHMLIDSINKKIDDVGLTGRVIYVLCMVNLS